MTFYHSYFFDLRAAGERIQRMANREQVEEATYFVSCRNKAYLIGILCIVCQWVFFQRLFLIPALLTFFFSPVQDHFHAGSVLVKLYLPFLILTNTFPVANSSVQCFWTQILMSSLPCPFEIVYIFQLYIKLPDELLANVNTVMITAENNCIERGLIWFNYSDQ